MGADSGYRQCVLLVGERRLCEGLAERLQSLSGNACTSGSASHVIHIANKYYTAEVNVVMCAPDALDQQLAAVCASHSIEGVIFVTARNNTDAVRQLEKVSQIQEGPDIRMCVVDTTERIPDMDSWRRALTFVCSEHCTECCEVSLEDQGLDEQLHTDEDPEGCKRVLEALGAHIWPEMTPVPHQQKAAPRSQPAPANSTDALRVEASDRIMRDMQGARPLLP